jgi:hypothetical protein
LLHFEGKGSKTDMGHALQYLTKVMKKRCVVFLVSDFLTDNYKKPLQISAHRHDIIPIVITDPTEIELPDVGLVELEDAETKECVLVDTSSPRVRKGFEEHYQEKVMIRTGIFRSAGIQPIDIINGQSYIGPVRQFFRNRERLH